MEKRSLYVSRPLLNVQVVRAWAKAQGIKTAIPDFHVTVAYSWNPVKWPVPDPYNLRVMPGRRSMKRFGEAPVLCLEEGADALHDRWAYFRRLGASWDHDEYRPHMTITYDPDAPTPRPFAGVLLFGPEVFCEVNPGWEQDEILLKYNPSQPRHPKGSALGGQWVGNGGSAAPVPPNIGAWGAAGNSMKGKVEAIQAAMGAGDLAAVQAVKLPEKGTNTYTKHAIAFKQAALQHLQTKAKDDADGVVNVGAMTKLSGKLGSNPGGIYVDKDGQKWYVKEAKSAHHAHNEVLAGKLYEAAGIATLKPQLADMGNGKLGIATKWQEGVVTLGQATPEQAKQIIAGARKGFGMDAMLANWDVVGMGKDNIGLLNGKVVRLDVGGALAFRAQGAPKGAAFGNTAPELATLRDATKNPAAASVFGGMKTTEWAATGHQVALLKPDVVQALVSKHPVPGVSAEKLLSRQQAVNNVASAVTGSAPVVGAVKVPLASSGIMPKAPLFPTKNPGNYQAQKATQLVGQLAAAAGSGGDIAAIKINPNSSSYHKKAFQYQNELLMAQGKPPLAPPMTTPKGAAPSLTGSGTNPQPLSGWDTLNGATPPKKVAYYPVVGEAQPSTAKAEYKALAPVKAETWNASHKAIFDNMSHADRKALWAYQGSGYVAINKGVVIKSLRHGTGKSAAPVVAAFNRHAVPIPDGTVLTRKIQLMGDDYKAMTKVAPGTVLLDKGFSSTSYGNTWAGNTVLHLKTKGVKALDLSKSGHSNAGEKEILLGPGAKYVITGTKYRGGQLIVEAIVTA